jgi:hypothetical protein
MGFDEQQLPNVSAPMRDAMLRVTDVRDPSDVAVFELSAATCEEQEKRLREIDAVRTFDPHPGWRGHIEWKVG